MFMVDKTEVKGIMLGEQLQLEMGEFRTELAMQILDNVFQVDQCHAFDFDVNEAPTAQTMFMANLSSADPIYDETEDTPELAEITRKRMLKKVKSPQCVDKKVKIAPPDCSKENNLATFTPQRHLTPL
ncbi:hypothetical protein Tco_0139934 [Tanacetum coccineum]